MSENHQKIIFLSACEASADAHCADLIRSIKKLDQNVRFVGIGGKRMQEAGCELLENTVSRAAMIYNAFSQVGFYFSLVKRVKKFFREHKNCENGNKIARVVVCDSPAFNFHIAKAAKKSGISTLFYVAPQLWAWAPWRIRKLRKCCDKLACILPFEQEWFSSRGVDCKFVGNPLFDEVEVDLESHKRDYAGYNPENATVAILPGSRDAEIDSLWGPMQQIALKLKAKCAGIKFVSVASDQEKLEKLQSTQLEGLDIEYSDESVAKTCLNADMTLVASGSAVLQVASSGCPTVVMYQSNRFLWLLIGKWIINTKYLSLVNILAGRELIPEFMPYFVSIDPIYAKVSELLSDSDALARINGEIIEIIKPLAGIKTCEEVAKMAL